MKKTLLIFFTCLSISCFAQFSKTHYIPPLTCATNLAGDQYLYISTPSSTDVNFKIITNGVTIFSGVVKNNTPYIYTVGQGSNTPLLTPKTTIGILSNKGFIVEAEDLIYVSVRLNAGFSAQNNTYVHAGGLVSKGNSALGKKFRLGAMLNPVFDSNVLNFASILSTENGTNITISNIPSGTVLSNGTIISGAINITLNKNESYVLALENYSNTISNSSKMIGALVESDKPIVVNSGSFGGSNSTILQSNGSPAGRDVGFDQIVPLEKTGKEYIFVKGLGTDELERILLIANEDNTKVFLDGLTLFKTINKGEYADIDGSKFTNGNLYVSTTEDVSAYQSIGGSDIPANQNLFFVPPLNCATPNKVDNIPFIESIGNTFYNGGLNIVTEAGATVTINSNPITGVPIPIIGNPNFVRYTINNLTGNIAVKSNRQVYVSYFGTNGAATYGGYYSGFDTKPEIVSNKISVSNSSCIPNVALKISTLSSYDTFQWYFNDNPINGANLNSYTPTQPGYYQVKGSILGCPSTVPIFSDKIPVSICPADSDNDGTNNNIDIDLDNDGIINRYEAWNLLINHLNPVLGAEYSGLINGSGSITGKPLYGFVSEVPAGKDQTINYTINFNKPESLIFGYVSQNDVNQTTPVTDYMNSDGDFIVRVPTDKTITVTDPNDQLLIDTNYDGIYESGIKEFSSFEIRFRLKNTTPLLPGIGSFKFQTYLTNSLTFSHTNLSETSSNRATFAIQLTQTFDSDSDGIPDLLDIDSDNDGIPDTIEAQGKGFKVFSGIDTNKDGLDNAFEPGLTPINSDNDTYFDFLDVDSDNDGIYDLVESGSTVIDGNLDGIIDGPAASFGINGLFDGLETSTDSGNLKNIILDTDNDGSFNYIDSDSDNDLCLDVSDAGFLDLNGDGFLGNNPLVTNANGKVTSGLGYTTPNINYIIATPIIITTQPQLNPVCELQNTSITLSDNGVNSYQWQYSSNGTIWNDITNNGTYSGALTNTLTITSVKNTMNGYKYRVKLDKAGNSCGLLSSETSLTVYVLSAVNPVTIIQCDDDLDAITTFNLTIKNDEISSNFSNETFTYYKTSAAANNQDPLQLITSPLAFVNTTPGIMTIWTRVQNANGCYNVAQTTLKVTATQIPISFKKSFEVCDDFLDIDGNNTVNSDKRDGISAFNFSSVTANIKAMLPIGNYTVSYYRNKADALSQINVITDITNYRNIGYPNTQQIWARVDSDVDNACYGLGPYITLTVEKLPFANTVIIARQCDDDQDGKFTFNTSTLESDLLQGQTNIKVTYFDQNNNPLPSPFPSAFSTKSQTIKAVVTNSTSLRCYDETNINFIVDDVPKAFPIATSLTTVCDDEADPLAQDGKFPFDTSTFENTILGGQTGRIVKYFDKKGALLPSPLPNPFISDTQNITAIVENSNNPNCSASVILSFIVNPLPRINLNSNGNEDELVCSNQPTFFVKLNAGIQDGSLTGNYTYIWSKDNTVLVGESNPTLQVNAEGNYAVEVTTLLGCSRTRKIKVTASDIAKIVSIVIVDLSEINTVTVNVTGQGQYQYSLNESSGPFQLSNFFTNVPSGIHEVFINDINGCGTVSRTISVIGVPKYFTPNGDGYNDYWNVKGINTNFNSNSTVHIFDRYGKLLKQVTPTNQGWDGTINGAPLPSDDYWFTIKLEDGRETRGHFSLKR